MVYKKTEYSFLCILNLSRFPEFPLCLKPDSLGHVQIVGKRWKLDLHSYQDASLMLSAVTLPGGVQVDLCPSWDIYILTECTKLSLSAAYKRFYQHTAHDDQAIGFRHGELRRLPY